MNKNNFHMKGFALRLALRQRPKATRKSPICSWKRRIIKSNNCNDNTTKWIHPLPLHCLFIPRTSALCFLINSLRFLEKESTKSSTTSCSSFRNCFTLLSRPWMTGEKDPVRTHFYITRVGRRTSSYKPTYFLTKSYSCCKLQHLLHKWNSKDTQYLLLICYLVVIFL